MTRFLLTTFTLLAAWLSGQSALAQIQLDRFFPPAAVIAGSTEVKAEGKFPSWPAAIECDRDDVRISAAEASGSLRVEVAENAPPGVAWVRLHDKTSASKLIPILIEPLAAVPETEPNNRTDESKKIALPGVLTGRLEKGGDLDTFAVTLSAGQTLVVSTIANQILGSPMDAVLQLVDGDGNVLAQADDVCGLDPQLVYPAERGGDFHIRLFAFPETPNSTIGYAGSASFVYLMRVTTGAYVDHVLPLSLASDTPEVTDVGGWNLDEKPEPVHGKANSAATVSHVPGALGWQQHMRAVDGSVSILESDGGPTVADSLPAICSGRLSEPGEVDRFRFSVQKDRRYRAQVHSREFGFPTDSVLRFVDPETGNELARNDDVARNQYDAAVEYQAKADGVVELQISDLVDGHGPRHVYSVVIDVVKPSANLSLSEDHYLVKAGESTEITVTVNRLNGFKQNLQVTAEKLPEGVDAVAVVSENKGASAKSVKLKLNAKADVEFQGNIRVVAHALDNDGNPTPETMAARHQVRKLYSIEDVWLTVAGKK